MVAWFVWILIWWLCIELDVEGEEMWFLGFNGMVVGGFNVDEMGGRRAINVVLKVGLNGVEVYGKSAINIVWSVGLNGVLRRREMRFGLLKRSVSEPFTEPLSLEPTFSFARAFLFRSSSLERPHNHSSEPLTEHWSLEPPPFFARPFLTRSSPLERIPNSLERTPSRELFAWATLVLRSTLPD